MDARPELRPAHPLVSCQAGQHAGPYAACTASLHGCAGCTTTPYTVPAGSSRSLLPAPCAAARPCSAGWPPAATEADALAYWRHTTQRFFEEVEDAVDEPNPDLFLLARAIKRFEREVRLQQQRAGA